MQGASRLPGLDDLTAFARLFEFRSVSRWIALSLVVGVFAGFAAAGFLILMDAVAHLTLVLGAGVVLPAPDGEASLFGHHAVQPRLWLIPIVPALGGLVAGVITVRFAPEIESHDALIDAFHNRAGIIRKRVPWLKAIAAAALVGTGGSGGREGPIGQIAAAFGSMLGGALRLSSRERRLLVLAGAAGGIGAIFRTPLGAALFVIEVLYRDDMEVDAIVPAVLSSVLGYSTFTLLFPEGGVMFRTAPHYAFDPLQLPLYLLMAVFAALVGVVYVGAMQGLRERFFEKLPLHPMLRPAAGGLLVGLLALALLLAFPGYRPDLALGPGYGWLQSALKPATIPTGWTGAGLLLGVAMLRVLATCLSVGSGGPAGVFGPTVVIGGLLGGSFGILFHQLAPNLVPEPTAFVIVGMACFVGGVASVPISSLVFASEMTGSYDLLVPVMLANAVTFVMLRQFSLYELQVPTRRDSPAHGGEYVLDVLADLRVGSVLQGTCDDVITVQASDPLGEVLKRASECKQSVFPVRAGAEGFSGLVTLETLRALFLDEELGRLAIAQDCATPFVAVTPDDTLAQALERFAATHYPQLPVVASATATGSGAASGQLVGILSYEELLLAYSQELARRRAESDPATRAGGSLSRF